MKLRTILVLALILVAMLMSGWISFRQSEAEINIRIDKQEIQEDTRHAIEKGKALIEDTQQSLDNSESN